MKPSEPKGDQCARGGAGLCPRACKPSVNRPASPRHEGRHELRQLSFVSPEQCIKGLRTSRRTLAAEIRRRERRAIAGLRAAGLDGATLVEKDKAFRAKIAAQRSSVREEWHGTDIKIPGYVVPLEFDGDQVSEFLLVPYAGACIHTPPPPANQIIHVKPIASFRVRGLFAPVWVSGRLSVERSRQNVGLSDGVAGFDVGYSLDASKVEDYVR